MVMDNPFLVAKRQRFEKIRKMLNALGEVDYARFVALVEIDSGLSNKVVREYIQKLKDAGYVTIEEGKIKPPNSHIDSHTRTKERGRGK